MVLVERGGAAGTGGGGALMGSSEAAPSWRTESVRSSRSNGSSSTADRTRQVRQQGCQAEDLRSSERLLR
jgi:hypothetical protein